jgi:outer membrane protein TolC
MKKVFLNVLMFVILTQRALCVSAHPESQVPANTLELSLDKTISLLMENNPEIKEADQTAQAALFRSKQKAGDLLPQVELDASYAKLLPDPTIAFPGFGNLQFFPEDNYDVHIIARQTLYDFGKKWDSYKATKYDYEAILNNAIAIKSNLIVQTKYTFYSIIFLQKSIAVQEQSMKSLNEYVEITQKKLANGTATDFDVLTIQVKLEEAKNKKVDLENKLAKQMITLRRLICVAEGMNVSINGDLQVQTEAIDTQSYLTIALKQRPELMAAHNMVSSAKMQMGSARSERYPALNLFYEYGYKNGYFLDLATIEENTAAGVEFQMPLFGGFKISNKIKEAEANYASIQSKEKNTGAIVAAEVMQAVSDVETNIKEIEAAELHVKLAVEAESQAKVRFANGVITNLDMLNAETALDEAQLLQLEANFNYLVSIEMLKKASGNAMVTGINELPSHT